MKLRFPTANTPSHRQRGFTLPELFVAVSVMLILFSVFVLPAMLKSRMTSSRRIKCMSNLKQVALSFKMFAGDNNGEFPFAVPGSPAYTNDTQAWLHFLSMSNELGSTRILLCPSDDGSKSKIVANIFGPTSTNENLLGLSTLKNSAVSYFVGLDARENRPAYWLTGDGGVGDTGYKHKGLLLFANENSNLQWPASVHEGNPNVAMADGSVQIGKKNKSLAPWPVKTSNRLLLPE